ncbi:MAG: DNA polymerase I [Bacteroidota bacterium]|nr:DNA polymerase I [Bacteroidota bacterium]
MDKLYIIDGHALIFRMYYAFARHPMINSKGADMSILFGFTKYLMELIDKRKPDGLAVAFDPPGGTFRNELYPAYKANRTETPQLVIDALEPLKELCGALNIPVLMVPGFEADDVIGTVAKRFASADNQVIMVTPDKDYGQLVEDNILQLKPGKGAGEDELFGPAEVCAKYGIQTPAQVIEMLTLCGDASDNVPGVKGVGEVGAAKLIGQFGSVENIYANLDKLSERQQAMFREAEGHIALSHQLVTIKTDVPVEVTAADLAFTGKYQPLAADLFGKYEFGSLKKHISGAIATGDRKRPEAVGVWGSASPSIEYNLLEVKDFQKMAKASSMLALGWSHGGDGLLLRAAAVVNGSVKVCDGDVPAQLMADSKVAKYGYGLKKLRNLLLEEGKTLEGRMYDIELMHYLLNPEQDHSPEVLAASLLGININEEPQSEGGLFADVSKEEEEDACRHAALCSLLGPAVLKELRDSSLDFLYADMEEPLALVLGKMERAGVKVDVAGLEEFAAELRKEIDAHEATVREMAGEPSLNVSSPKQVGDVLFDKLHLDPKAKKSARGSYSTDETTLQELYDRHLIIGEILEYRAAKKLLSTYIDPLPGYISPVDGRIHTTFNQALTATGRLSSSNPNLQNIPVRTERGMQIRKAFVPGTPDGVILSADYSQIELRIMAHLSGDPHMVDAFRHGLDIHAATAAKIYGVPVEAVTQDQRRVAKTANFGIIYGISSFGLAQRLHISRTEAKGIIDDYFAAFPQVLEFIESCKEGARKDGYVKTMFGRRRYLPLINSSNKTMRELAERNAVNAPIQGTAADIIKLAMIAVDRRMQKEALASKMVLQIHDELLFDTVDSEKEILKALVCNEMENVLTLSVPLTVECNYGKNWLEAH